MIKYPTPEGYVPLDSETRTELETFLLKRVKEDFPVFLRELGFDPADGWIHNEMQMSAEGYADFHDNIAGPENIHWLIKTKLQHKKTKEVFEKGHYLINRVGRDRVSAYVEAKFRNQNRTVQ